ncbi:MAG: serine/threonine-protein phosphatase [Oscillospiraceae bacterium]|jgi:serine/threonine protein phosphatase PrpC|nr:serine/threonine-protein phosphatase [Oscillospiraceae bacterium]
MNYLISASTDIGIKKHTNQDSLFVKMLKGENCRVVFAVLCDGMGGLAKGEVASATLVKAFNDWLTYKLPLLLNAPIEDGEIRRQWEEIIFTYNQKLMDYGCSCGVNLGTTVTALLLTDTRYFIVNVGDGRAYEISDALRQITIDQTVVMQELRMGIISPEKAANDPRQNVLLQCVGASEVLVPDFFFGQTKQHAVYMLCSDGFRHQTTPEELYYSLEPNRMTSPELMKQQELMLIDVNKQRDEHDNISVITIRTY